tara:strand:+ start:168 stop:1070 length:903 start_codon:yes stop_codon:yes gene_type:complete
MAFYNQEEKLGSVLKNILNNICDKEYNYELNNIAVTWITYDKRSPKGFGYGINNHKKIYPASLVKLVYGLATYSWIEDKRILYSSQLEDAVFKMLQYSSNDATSFIVDLLTGTTSGPSLEGEDLIKWTHHREIINDWLRELNWEELQGFNCCQKTWEDAPYGREKDYYGASKMNRNFMTTDGVARIMEEIMQNIQYRENNVNLRSCLFRELTQASLSADPNNQVKGFLGEGIPEKNHFWSKAGLMSEVRHDAAWWINENKSKTLLVVFTEGQKIVNDTLFLPAIAKAIYTYNQEYSINLP